MDQGTTNALRGAVQAPQRRAPALVFLPPADEAPVERAVECDGAGEDHDSAALNSEVGAVFERLALPLLAAEDRCGALLIEAEDAAVGNRPRRTVRYRLDRRVEVGCPAVGVSDDDHIGVGCLDRGHHRLGLAPRLATGSERDRVAMVGERPLAGAQTVLAGARPGDDDLYRHRSKISPSASGSSEWKCSVKTSRSWLSVSLP